jgi:hypothetical protein
MFALAQQDGNLVVLDPPDPPEACWAHPEGAEKDPIAFRGAFREAASYSATWAI